MIQIPLSAVGSAAEFAAALDRHRAHLEAHRLGEPGIAAPVVHELIDSLIRRVPQQGPVEERGPDQFAIAEYEVVDDTPPTPPVPSLADRRRSLLAQLDIAAAAAADEILSPARARLVAIEAHAAMALPEGSRSPAQVAALELFQSYTSRRADIDALVARAAVAIDDLTEADIDGWEIPAFE